jgi:plastocyanin
MVTRRTFVKGTLAVPALLTLSACGSGSAEEANEAAQDVATRIPAAGAPTFEAATGGSPAAEEAAPAAGGAAPAGGAPAPAGGAPAPAGNTVTIEGGDIYWEFNGQRSLPNQPITVPVAPGTTISLPNVGAIAHNFQADDFGFNEDMPVGETIEVQIPADAAPGEYPFICNVPGHEVAMSGILQVGAAAAQAPAGGEPAPAGEAPPPAAGGGGPITIEGGDIFWRFNGEQSLPNQPIRVPVTAGATISLPNVGAIAHNFQADDFNLNEDMPVGQTIEVQIPADAQPGEYPFICNVPGHEVAMSGVLVIQ